MGAHDPFAAAFGVALALLFLAGLVLSVVFLTAPWNAIVAVVCALLFAVCCMGALLS
jgi:protein-S-isoprenylcysteine O-methyltransferase Ste14